jgi:Bax protein
MAFRAQGVANLARKYAAPGGLTVLLAAAGFAHPASASPQNEPPVWMKSVPGDIEAFEVPREAANTDVAASDGTFVPGARVDIDSLLQFPGDEGPPILLAGGMPAASPRLRIVADHRVASTGHLETLFRSYDYSLAVVRRGEPVPALRLDRLPSDLGQARAGLERIELFIKSVLPLVLQTNEAILADREELLRLRAQRNAGGMITAVEKSWLAELADRYGCEATNLDEMVRRVDIVPPSMALAQGGVESGWGTSYAARAGNSLFGHIQVATRRGSAGSPWSPGPAMPQGYNSIGESVEDYIFNLNSHPAYAAFRADRAAMRMQGVPLDGHRLIGHLLRYSERGQSYIDFVRQIMREGRLTEFDTARLPPL